MKGTDRRKSLEKIAASNGIDLLGVADLRNINGIRTYPQDLMKPYRYGISLVISLDRFIDAYSFDIEEQVAFPLIRGVSCMIADFIRDLGYKAITLDPNDGLRKSGPLYFKSKLSMKAVAMAAGLGWIGKSAVFVSERFGPRVCLGVVLTDIPLKAGVPMGNKCGACDRCVQACPVGALTATSFETYPSELRKVLQREICNDWMESRSPTRGFCWGCILACPKGKK